MRHFHYLFSFGAPWNDKRASLRPVKWESQCNLFNFAFNNQEKIQKICEELSIPPVNISVLTAYRYIFNRLIIIMKQLQSSQALSGEGVFGVWYLFDALQDIEHLEYYEELEVEILSFVDIFKEI